MRIGVVAVAVFLLLAVPSRAAWAPSALTSLPGSSLEPGVSLSIGPDGTAAIAWSVRAADGRYGAFYAIRPPGSPDFGAPVQLVGAGNPWVAVGPGGKVGLLANVSGGLAFGFLGGSAQLLPGTSGAGEGKVALDAAGNATIVYAAGDKDPGEPGVLALTVSADGVPTLPQPLHDSWPDEYMDVHVAPGGQAAITFSGTYLAYRAGPSSPFEPTVRLPSDGYSGLHTAAAFDAAGSLYLSQVDKQGDEFIRTGFRPVGGALSFSAIAPVNARATLVAPDPAGGAVAACDCGPDGELFTRAISGAGVFAAPLAEQPRTGTLMGWQIAPDGSRVALWLYGRTLVAGARPPGGAWALTPLAANGWKDAWLAVGPSGEAIAAWQGIDERLYVATTGAAPIPTGGAGAAASPGGTALTAPATRRVPARAALRGLVTQVRAGIAADRKRVARGRSLKASKRATKALRVAVVAIKPDTAAARRGRRALLQSLDHRAQALTARRVRTAKRLLTLASRDVERAAKYLR